MRSLPSLLAVVLFLLPLSFATAQIVGGWKKLDVKEPAVIEAADFAIKAQQAAQKKLAKTKRSRCRKSWQPSSRSLPESTASLPCS
ncbi:hypothetical protein [Anatilimnocola floriformis]|uniref:hypothetical protein n=1 Tax=Anatilimnocola floriformis TaxID=2948575 RepID=UPI0020C3847B|nr:hypothetical protein [Anatilimnocola floriformis]